MKSLIENDYILKELNHSIITASFGLTTLKSDDNIDDLMNRADIKMIRECTPHKVREIED